MDYRGKKVTISGADGFLGYALVLALNNLGADVYFFKGDIRNYDEVADGLDHTFDYYFHFGAPSSQILFKRNHRYCIDTTINGFLNVSRVCKENGIKLIYPSTGLLSQGKTNEYASCKKMCEDIHLGENMDALGLRIFATYGPGEGHKSTYASAPYLFARSIMQGKRPIIWGNGEQKRDFVYITDVVRAILILAEEADERIIDIGSGITTSFNEVISLISNVSRKKVEPIYVGKPDNYVEETLADQTVLRKYYQPDMDMQKGIKAMYESEDWQ